MLEADRAQFIVGLQALATTLRFDLTEAIIEGYWQGLEDVEVAAIGVAMRRAWRECEWMPAPAKLREFAGRGPNRLPKPEEWRDPYAADRKRIRDSWVGPERQLLPRGKEQS